MVNSYISLFLMLGGKYDEQPANEYCFTLSNAVVTISSDDVKYVHIICIWCS